MKTDKLEKLFEMLCLYAAEYGTAYKYEPTVAALMANAEQVSKGTLTKDWNWGECRKVHLMTKDDLTLEVTNHYDYMKFDSYDAKPFLTTITIYDGKEVKMTKQITH